ncbi:MAG: DUF362 domain-containing protein [Coriobacteriia bacterium]
MSVALMSTVAVCGVRESVRAAVRTAMDAADWSAHIPVGSRVALKPNLCWDLPLPGAQTSPWFLDAVIEVLKPHVADIIVVEAGQVTVDADVALRRCGLDRVLAAHAIPFVNMSHGGFHATRVEGAAVLHHVELPDVLDGRVLITLPVLKTHATTTITGALKNQWGCLRELRHNHHLVVDSAIADLNAALRPAFAIMDGTVGLEGNGPKTGRPRVADLVFASADMVALDATAARIMGFSAREIAHIAHAANRGLGALDRSRIVFTGDAPTDLNLQFLAPRPGLIQRTEFALRRSRLRQLAFDTPLLSVLALAAKAHNAAWWLMAGRRERGRIVTSSRYGRQWLGFDEPRDVAWREPGGKAD